MFENGNCENYNLDNASACLLKKLYVIVTMKEHT